MRRTTTTRHLITVLFFALAVISFSPTTAGIIADHTATSGFDSIPSEVVSTVTQNIRMFYVHTSHGSQLLQGMSIIESLDGHYQPPLIVEYADDLGEGGDVSWIPIIGDYLDTNTVGCNLVSISWCWGAYTYDEAQTNVYLQAFDSLAGEYPGVTFMYQTSRMPSPLWDQLDPGRRIGINRTNNQIRAYCDTAAGDTYLFDFGDIESWDPDGVFYDDATDTCLWCYDWCAAHDCPDCVDSDENWLYGDDECAHSHCFNCYRKGKAFWWLLARMTGWNPGQPVNHRPEITSPLAVMAAEEESFVYVARATDSDGDDVYIHLERMASWMTARADTVMGTPQVAAPDTSFVIIATDGELADTCEVLVTVIEPATCGDANADGEVSVGDAVYLVAYVFKQGPPPVPVLAGDANGDGEVNVGDISYLINYIFKEGPPPDCQ